MTHTDTIPFQPRQPETSNVAERALEFFRRVEAVKAARTEQDTVLIERTQANLDLFLMTLSQQDFDAIQRLVSQRLAASNIAAEQSTLYHLYAQGMQLPVAAAKPIVRAGVDTVRLVSQATADTLGIAMEFLVRATRKISQGWQRGMSA